MTQYIIVTITLKQEKVGKGDPGRWNSEGESPKE